MGENDQEMLAPAIRKHLNMQMITTRIETPRLLLRDWVEEDALSVLAVFGNEEVVRWTGAVPIPDVANARQWVGMSNHHQEQHGVQEWAVVERQAERWSVRAALGTLMGNWSWGWRMILPRRCGGWGMRRKR
jgi:RimJ/RimL family protein N-acetyltransferase